MKLGVPKEIIPGERRVALVPESVQQLVKKGVQVLIESGAGTEASFLDSAYEAAGATIVPSAADIYSQADLICKVGKPDPKEVDIMKPGSVLITFFSPLVNHDLVKMLAEHKITSFSMDAIPRTTRAQSMDALSSMSTVAGYKSVLMASDSIGKFFPLLMTAAGTVPPARVFVLGAGVAGLMAIATARRLGAVVEAFDVRPVVKEQVESLGAKFVEMPIEEQTQTAGGYATQLSEEAHKREVELLHKHVKDSDVVITTALIPGRPAPELVNEAMVRDMKPGSVIVDLAAENGGNCALTEPGCDFIKHNVRILGPLNVPSMMPIHSSQLYSKNMLNLLALMVTKDGQFTLNMEDDIVAGTLITHDGQIKSAGVLKAMGVEAPVGGNA
ncbi:MAG TPA: Re/Si-specific NAD(P)(+) transhydrogenase subunit alpha [Chloroflexia bacterium]|nr:Re/Si-specific NAD(P)(+) transhydrogenase subunit alpha [Chloroflexia bacterium]